MGIEVVDKMGEPRSDKDLQDAIDCINIVMVKQPFAIPLLTVHAGIIKDCLSELQVYRKMLAEAKARRLNKE